MQVVNVGAQGSKEWHEHRAAHWNASDAPAVMGCSKYLSRDALLRQYATGICKEFSDWVQENIIDRGHRFEALARPLAEKIIGEDLSPVIGVLDHESGKYSASFDGITFAGDINWEHKSLNDAIRECDSAEELPLMYRAQMEQQLLVSGADKTLFMATTWNDDDTQAEEPIWFWYKPDLKLRKQLIAAWKQFMDDVKNWEHTPEPQVVKGEPVALLPMPNVQAVGQLTASNLADITPKFDSFLDNVNTELTTDLHFAQAQKDAKALREMGKKLGALQDGIVNQMTDIAEATETLKTYQKRMNAVALTLEKAVKTEKDNIKAAAIMNAKNAYIDYMQSFNADLHGHALPVNVPDFAGRVKGVRTVKSMHERINDTLAEGKAEAKVVFDDYVNKLGYILPAIKEKAHLFDVQALLSRDMEYIELHIAAEIRKDDERLAAAVKKKQEAEEAKKAEEQAAREAREAEAAKKAAEAAEQAQQPKEQAAPVPAAEELPASLKPQAPAPVKSKPLSKTAKPRSWWDEGAEFYVVVSERDTSDPNDDVYEPIVWETSISYTSLDDAKQLQERRRGQYGRTRIARLVFIDEDEQREAG